MAYDERLAERIRTVLARRGRFVEKKMFGGVAFMVAGRMACGVVKKDLMARVGPAEHERALARPHARPMDFTGRPMRGFVFVAPAGLRTAAGLRAWVDRAVENAVSQPKAKTATRRRRAVPKVKAVRRRGT